MNHITKEDIDTIISAVHNNKSKEVITDLLLDMRLTITKD